MEPYREPERAGLSDFVQHISIAEQLLAEFVSYPARAQALLRRGSVSVALLADLRRAAATAWEQLWIQLGEGRRIAARLGRDVSDFDASRKRAGDIWSGGAELDIGAWRQDGYGRRRVVRWRSAYEEPARAAISALRATVPEVVIVSAPKNALPVDLRPRCLWPWIALAGISVAIVHCMM